LNPNQVAATFAHFGVRFSVRDLPDSMVKTNEDFLIYLLNHIFDDGRTAKAGTSWIFVFLEKLDKSIVLEKMQNQSNAVKSIFISILSTLNKRDLYHEVIAYPLKERLVPFMELHEQGNPFFNEYNISVPLLSPEVAKYIKESFRNS
jgi:hypothetical protein